MLGELGEDGVLGELGEDGVTDELCEGVVFPRAPVKPVTSPRSNTSLALSSIVPAMNLISSEALKVSDSLMITEVSDRSGLIVNSRIISAPSTPGVGAVIESAPFTGFLRSSISLSES